MFIKVKKYFRGGRTEKRLWLPGKPSDDEIAAKTKYWGEHSAGGHYYGYSIKWEVLQTTRRLIKEELREVRSSEERALENYENSKHELLENYEDSKRELNAKRELLYKEDSELLKTPL